MEIMIIQDKVKIATMLTEEALWDPKEERFPEEREKWALRKRGESSHSHQIL